MQIRGMECPTYQRPVSFMFVLVLSRLVQKLIKDGQSNKKLLVAKGSTTSSKKPVHRY